MKIILRAIEVNAQHTHFIVFVSQLPPAKAGGLLKGFGNARVD